MTKKQKRARRAAARDRLVREVKARDEALRKVRASRSADGEPAYVQ